MSPGIRYFANILLLAPHLVASRHIRHLSHHKHVRHLVQITSSPYQPSSTPAFFTAGDAAISDIQDIQSGLSDLPGDLLNFIRGIEERLEQMEALLESLMGGSHSRPTVPSVLEPPAPFTPVPFPAGPTRTITSIASSLNAVPVSNFAPTLVLPTNTPHEATTTTTSSTAMLTSTRTRTITHSVPSASSFGIGLPTNGSSNTTRWLFPSALSSSRSSMPLTISIDLNGGRETETQEMETSVPSTLVTLTTPTATTVGV